VNDPSVHAAQAYCSKCGSEFPDPQLAARSPSLQCPTCGATESKHVDIHVSDTAESRDYRQVRRSRTSRSSRVRS
jgi:PHP family Zn ribbon phosphoesterase